MRTRPFTAGKVVSELSLGTWGLSGDGYGPVSEAVQDEVIQRARAYGITLYETADVYAKGGDYRRDEINETALVDELGIELRVLAHRPGLSSRDIIARLRRDDAPRTATRTASGSSRSR